MYRIKVTRDGYLVAVYWNKDKEIGLQIAKDTHGKSCKYSVNYVEGE